MAEVGDVTVRLRLDLGDFAPRLQQASQQVRQAGQQMAGLRGPRLEVDTRPLTRDLRQASTGIDEVQASLGALAGGFAALRISAFVSDLALTAARTEVLNTVLGQVAKTAGISRQETSQLVGELKRLGISTQEASSAATQFIQNRLNLAQLPQLADVSRNAAVIANENTSQTLSALIAGIVTLQPEILRTRGLIVNLEQEYTAWAQANGRTAASLTGTEKQAIALNAVLRAGDGIAGTYRAAMEDVGKQLTSLPRLHQEAANAIGQSFLPTLGLGVRGLAEFYTAVGTASPQMQNLIAAVTGGGAAVVGFAGTAAGLARVLPLLSIGTFLTTPAGLAALAVGGLTAAVIAYTGAQYRAGEAHRQAVKDLSQGQRLLYDLATGSVNLGKTLGELAAKTTLTQQEQATLFLTLQRVERLYPGLTQGINLATGAWEEQAKAIKKVATSVDELAQKRPWFMTEEQARRAAGLPMPPGGMIPGEARQSEPTPEQRDWPKAQLLGPNWRQILQADEAFRKLFEAGKGPGGSPSQLRQELEAVNALIQGLQREPRRAIDLGIAKTQADVDGYIRTLQERAKRLREELAGGAVKPDRAAAKEAREALRELEERMQRLGEANEQLRERAIRLWTDIQTPQERYVATIREAAELLEAHLIDVEEFGRAVQRAAQDLGLPTEVEEHYRQLQQTLDELITPQERFAAQQRLLQELLDRGKISVDQYNQALRRYAEAIPGAITEADRIKETSDLARELGLSFSSAFEDAIVQGKQLGDVIDGLTQDLQRVLTRKLLTEPLINWLGGAFQGTGGAGGLGGWISSMFGFGGSSPMGSAVTPLARGGVVTRPTLAWIGERGPEAVIPLQAGAIASPTGLAGLSQLAPGLGAMAALGIFTELMDQLFGTEEDRQRLYARQQRAYQQAFREWTDRGTGHLLIGGIDAATRVDWASKVPGALGYVAPPELEQTPLWETVLRGFGSLAAMVGGAWLGGWMGGGGGTGKIGGMLLSPTASVGGVDVTSIVQPAIGPSAMLQSLVPAYQHGGHVRAPTLALIGEKGPEAVIPLHGQAIHATMDAWGRLSVTVGQGVQIPIIPTTPAAMRVPGFAEGALVGMPAPLPPLIGTSPSPAGWHATGGSGRGVTINVTVNAMDANSFRASHNQIAASMALALKQAEKRQL